MILDKSFLFSVGLLSSSLKVEGFASLAPTVVSGLVVRTSGQLGVGVAVDWNEQDLDESFLMRRAEACANSDSCSLEDARISLDDVLHVQSGCVTGTVLGKVCENVDTAAAVVANLRQKIEQKTREAIVVTTGVNVAAIAFTTFVLAVLASGLVASNVDSTPFTLQEWWWALRDGYVPQMLAHYFRHGGLATMEDYDPETTPFAIQEWWWAVKGGYLNNMLEHYFRNGGLATVENNVPGAVAFTPNEWLHAIQGGYVENLVHHNFQHGGLATAESVYTDAMAVTPQELFWAARDGYIGQFSEHFFRNGGV